MSEIDVDNLSEPNDINFYKIRGTVSDRWYTAPIVSSAIFGVAGSVANIMFAIPFITSKDITLDRIAINVTIGDGVNPNARLGIYYDNGNLYPDGLLLDAGVVNVAGAGVKTIVINQPLSRGLYWLCLVTNGTPTIRTIPTNDFISILGFTNLLGTAIANGYTVAQAYGPLPTTFPAGANYNTAANFAIYVRLA